MKIVLVKSKYMHPEEFPLLLVPECQWENVRWRMANHFELVESEDYMNSYKVPAETLEPPLFIEKENKEDAI